MERKVIFFRRMGIIWLWLFTVAQAVSKDGDFILGGLFNVHQFPAENSKGQCGELDTKGLGRAMAMIFAIETINNNSNLLPNITLGYDIRDYCENATKAIEMTFELIKDSTCSNKTRRKMETKSPLIAFIGPFESRTALAINGFLQILDVPAISGTTTSPELNSNTYSYWYRTAPTDTFLAKAMADIIEHFKWTYVAAVGLDDSYGRNGVRSVIKEAARRNGSFCVAMKEFIPLEAQLPSIRNIVSSLRRQENIRVIILWTYGSHERNFFSEVNRQNLTGRVWILSDVSVTLKTFVYSDTFTINESIGFQPHRFTDTGFTEYIIELLTKGTNRQNVPEWWSEAKALTRSCPTRKKTDTHQIEVCIQGVVQDILGSNIPYVIDAVYSVAHAIQIGLAQASTSMTDDHCQQELSIDLLDMRRLLSKINFIGLSGNVTFDEFGDRESAVYDIVKFQQVQDTDGKLQLKQTIVGKWEANGQSSKRMRHYNKMHWNSANDSAPKSECLDQCPEGTRKSITSPCCWQCVRCPRGTVNTFSGSENCIECPRGKLSNWARTKCVDLPLINIKYSSFGGIVVLAFLALGVLGTIFSFAVYCRFWNTPIVKASNRTLSLALLAIILMMLSLTLMNLLEPTDTICKIIYPWRYITYNLCLSILLVKVLRISSAFQIPITLCCTIPSFTNRVQVVVVITLQVILLLVLLPWLLLDPPVSTKHILTDHYIFIECKAYNYLTGKILFLLTFCCVLLQMLLCAFSSFKIRNIPENFGEAKRIAFSMYIFMFSLLAYHPVEFSMDGWYVTVVDCVTTLLTSYGFLCCIFLPKLYIIIVRPELNNSSTLSQQVTNYSFGISSVRANPALNSSTL
ncbi:extracellular calcium-sensing receptor-like [Orbicella faveolata]|uniref:extracellular calcium-sensing receptor-like n=1 Tax=Orbicella faveolata TaxID=48498 RepID=UPI0009E47476|nr:extracellular calcium-sensing receptor-like [Orbicella faveolata]